MSYGVPLSDDWRLDTTGLISNSDVATVGDTNVLGDGTSLTMALTRTLKSGPGFYHRIGLSAAWKDFKEDTVFGNAVSKAPITYFPVSLNYTGSASDDHGTFGYDLAVTFAFRGLGSDSIAFDTKRYRATGGFAYLHSNVDYLYNLPRGFQAWFDLEAQMASEPLISNEQMALGGPGTMRGYLQSEAIGDNGYRSTIELRSPALGLGKWVDEARLIAFADSGRVWLIDPLPEQQRGSSLFSLGGGLRLKLLHRLSGDLDVGVPLMGSGATRAGDVRVHFRVSADF